MSDSAGFAMHRPELTRSFIEGERKLKELMQETVEIAAEQVLIEAQTQHDFVYRLRSGWMARVRASEDGRQQTILVFLPGDLFAVKSMFMRYHPDRVQTLSDCVVEKIHYRKLHAAFNEDGDIANRCIWQVLEEERRLHSWVFGLGQGNADERIALLLCDFRGRLVTSGVIDPDALTFDMPLTQSQLADHLGITAIHVNRVLKALREAEIATIRSGEVTIHSIARLREIALPLLDEHERRAAAYGAPPSGHLD